MARYHFVTPWEIEALAEDVWDKIVQPERWPTWWNGVERVFALAPGDEQGKGAMYLYTWRSRLPNSISFYARTTRVERYRLYEWRALSSNGTMR